MKKILLVEDDEALGQGICLALNSESTAVTHCKNLLQGRQPLGAADFALLPDGAAEPKREVHTVDKL